MAFRGMQISAEQIAEMLQCKSGPVCLPLSLPHIPPIQYMPPLSCPIKHRHTQQPSNATVFDCEATHVKI